MAAGAMELGSREDSTRAPRPGVMQPGGLSALRESLSGQAEELVRGQREDAKHEVGHDLD
jgi:hypothetical protein